MAPAADDINPASTPAQERDEKKDAGSDTAVGAEGAEKVEIVSADMASSLPTEAIRRIWTKGPLIAVFCG
jgi:hypothetical protein